MSGQAKLELTVPNELLDSLKLIAQANSRSLHGLVLEAINDVVAKYGPSADVMKAYRESVVQFGDVYRKFANPDI